MSEYVYAGLTSQTIDLFIRDSSSSTGQGLTGLAYNSGSLVASYRKGATGSRTAITLATQTVTGSFSSGGFVEIDATNMPGCYRLDLPNAAVDTAGFVTVFLKGAANMVPVALRIDCRPLPVDVKQFGGTNGTFSSGRPEVNATHVSGTSQTAGDIYASQVAIAGFIDTEVGAIKTKTDQLTFTTANKVDSTAVLDSASRDAVADAVWDEAMADHTGSGSYGGRVVRASNSNTTVQITGSNHVAADVHELQAGVITAGDFANNSITAAALAADAVTEIQSGLSTLTASQVNAEVVDALSVDTYAELTAPPAATSSLKDKITWLFMYARNKVTQTASQRKLYRDDGTTVAGTSGTSDDGTTFTKGEDA